MAFNPETQMVLMVRHGSYGKTAADPKNPLTETGIAQMQRAAEAVASKFSDKRHSNQLALYSSTAARAMQSAKVLLDAMKVSIDVTPSDVLYDLGNDPYDLEDGGLVELLESIIGDSTATGIIMVTHAPLVAAMKLGRIARHSDGIDDIAPNGAVVKVDLSLW